MYVGAENIYLKLNLLTHFFAHIFHLFTLLYLNTWIAFWSLPVIFWNQPMGINTAFSVWKGQLCSDF
jgi:hypothetical protein